MAKENQEEKIKCLENNLKNAYDEIQKLNNEIRKLKNEEYTLEDIKELERRLQSAKNNSDKWHREYFAEQCKYKELNKKYQELEIQVEKLEKDNSKLKMDSKILKEVIKRVKELEKENEQLKNNGSRSRSTTHNERGAGRKSRFTDEQIEKIRMHRLQGKKIKEIAEMFDCSIGLIHKLINEK